MDQGLAPTSSFSQLSSYGTIEEEGQKSYIQLEYEYALAQGKALFAIVITDAAINRKVKKMGKKAIEQKNPDKLENFRKTVCGKIVRDWNDVNEIKLGVTVGAGVISPEIRTQPTTRHCCP